MNEVDVHGPIDFVLLEFSGGERTGETAAELFRLVDQGTIRLYDLVVLRKEADGTVSGLALDEVEGLAVFAGATSGLLGDEDLQMAADAMEPDTVAALLVYENAWAIPFVSAALRAGGQLVASARIPAQDLLDTLDGLEAEG